MTSVRMDTMARYARFVRGLMASPSMEVVVMCSVARKDIRSVTGRNVAMIAVETGLDPMKASIGKVKERLSMRVASVPDRDIGRLGYLARLLSDRGEAHYRADDEEVPSSPSSLTVCVTISDF